MNTSPQHLRSNIPDASGINLFESDPYARAMLQAYLPSDLYTHLLPHFVELGGLAGSTLDELARVADQNPPALSVRNRTGEDESRVDKHPAYVELERMAYSKYGQIGRAHV